LLFSPSSKCDRHCLLTLDALVLVIMAIGEKLLRAVTAAPCAFALFFLVHFFLGLAMIIMGAIALFDGTCIYPTPLFLVVSGCIAVLSAFFPLAALLNVGPLIWGTVVVFALYEDYLLRFEVDAAVSSSCDTLPFLTALVAVILLWSFFCHFVTWMLLNCEIGSRFKALKNRARGKDERGRTRRRSSPSPPPRVRTMSMASTSTPLVSVPAGHSKQMYTVLVKDEK